MLKMVIFHRYNSFVKLSIYSLLASQLPGGGPTDASAPAGTCKSKS